MGNQRDVVSPRMKQAWEWFDISIETSLELEKVSLLCIHCFCAQLHVCKGLMQEDVVQIPIHNDAIY